MDLSDVKRRSRRHLFGTVTALGLASLMGTRSCLEGAASTGLLRESRARSSTQQPPPPEALVFELVGTPADYGRPLSHQYLAELQLWHDRIYIGHGDWTTNTGPVHAIYLDLATGAFVHDDSFSFDDEAIESFVVLDDVLYAIGTDALEVEGWEFGNLYRKDWGSAWEKLRTVPRALHIFGLGQLGDVLVASGTTDDAVGVIWQSWDGGYTWETVASLDNPDPESKNPRFVRSHVLTLGGYLIVTTPWGSCYVFDGSTWSTRDCTAPTTFGVAKSVQFGNAAVMAPYLPFYTRGSRWRRELVFFDGQEHWSIDVGMTVRDIAVDGNVLYVLVDNRGGAGTLLATADPSCRCAAAFTTISAIPSTFARPRSLARAADRFFVGTADGKLIRSTPYSSE